jgi:TPR repeat protein
MLVATAGVLHCFAQSSPPENKAATPGEEQLDLVLRDRPQLQTVVQKGSPIWTWLKTAFEGANLGYQIEWRNDATGLRISGSSSISSAYADVNEKAYVEVDGINEEGPATGTERSAEEILSNLVFELNNVRHGPEKQKLDEQARAGTISHDDFIRACFREEYLADRETADFYHTIWVPFCKAKGLEPHPTPWHALIKNTWQENLATYPPEFWYPWHFYGDRYDRYAALRGSITPRNQPVNFKDLLAKAEKGDAEAEEQVGRAYFWGSGVTKDDQIANGWYLKAAAQNNIQAEKNLACFYEKGAGVPKDESKAFNWALKVADQGDPVFARLIAERYESGLGVVVDKSKAIEWYKKAAREGDSDAQAWLGYALFEGRGMQKDRKQGFTYFLEASRESAYARGAIAQCYARGNVVARDYMQAYKWCLIALEKDQQTFELSQWLKIRLTLEQIQQAGRDALAWDQQQSEAKPTPPQSLKPSSG